MFSCEHCKIFTSTYFEEHLRKTASKIAKVRRSIAKQNMLFIVFTIEYLNSKVLTHFNFKIVLMILLGQLSYIKFFFLRIKKIFDNFKLKKVLLYLLILFGYFGERSIYCVYVAVATSI